MAQCHSWPNGVYVSGLGFGNGVRVELEEGREKQECFLFAGSWKLALLTF